MSWRHTHTVTTPYGYVAEVYLAESPGPAYTREEWDADASADIECRDDGGWYFLGQPCLEVRRAR